MDNIFWTKIKNLRYMFYANGYLNWFFDKCVETFLKIKAPRLKDKKNVNEEKLFSVFRMLANPHSFSQYNYLS